MTHPRITLAQINVTVGDIDGNVAKIMNIWDECGDSVDLIAFPELVLCGYTPEDLILKPAFLDAIETALGSLIEHSKTRSAAILISCPWRANGKTYSAAHIIDQGRITGTTLKHALPNYGVFDEKRLFSAGPLPIPLDFRGYKLGVLICEDLWTKEPAQHLKDNGAQSLLTLNASPFHTNKHDMRQDLAKTRTQETGLPLAYVNLIGGQDELVFDGGSFFMDAAGQTITQAPLFEETTLTPQTPTSKTPDENTRIYRALTLGLRDYTTKNGFTGVLLGLSGGIDSALSAAIACDALGAQNVHAYMLPSNYTSQDSLDDAAQLARTLGIQLHTLPITDAHKTLASLIEPYMHQNDTLTDQNIQSRIRGLILMALSNATGHMLLTTGNKSEMAVGYATLYGDMNGGFNALKDVYKTKVYELAQWLNREQERIPARIITKAPTAELKDDQTDQDSLPPYDILDAILQGLIEHDEGIKGLIDQGYEEKTVKRVNALLNRAEYKRFQSPPGTKITPKAFGKDRRYPMTNGFAQKN